MTNMILVIKILDTWFLEVIRFKLQFRPISHYSTFRPPPADDLNQAQPTYDSSYLPQPSHPLPPTFQTASLLPPPPLPPANSSSVNDPFVAVAASQDAADRWKDYSTTRRFGFRRQQSNFSNGWSTARGGVDGAVGFSFAGVAGTTSAAGGGGSASGVSTARLGSDNRLACLGLSSIPDEVDGGVGSGSGSGDGGNGKATGNGKGTPAAGRRRRQNLAQSRALIQYFSRLGESQKDEECVDLKFVDSLLKAGADINCRDKV